MLLLLLLLSCFHFLFCFFGGSETLSRLAVVRCCRLSQLHPFWTHPNQSACRVRGSTDDGACACHPTARNDACGHIAPSTVVAVSSLGPHRWHAAPPPCKIDISSSKTIIEPLRFGFTPQLLYTVFIIVTFVDISRTRKSSNTSYTQSAYGK